MRLISGKSSFPSRFSLFLRNNSSTKQVKNELKLNLPDAGKFELSMKNICKNEENIRKLADFDGLYTWQQNERRTSPVFTLHDGPPYANGDIHIGHMVNKVLKDIYIRYKLVSGYRVDYKPGWDCHGLPIELNALKSLKKQKNTDSSAGGKQRHTPIELRKLANEYAHKYINVQMSSFKNMNLVADWNNIYKTIQPEYMCNEIDVFYNLYEKKLIYRDYMPVYWSVSSQTALAEAELEYNLQHVSHAMYVAFELVNFSDEIKRFLNPQQKLFALVWTTTPWSLPCNKAIAFNPNLNYGLVTVNDRAFLIESELIASVVQNVPYFTANAPQIDIGIKINGRHLKNAKYISPFIESPSALPELISSDHVDSKQGTGLVHIAPALGHDDFKLALKHKLTTKCVIDANGKYTHDDAILTKHQLNGLDVLKETTTARIKEILNDSLVHEHTYTHSYPYDWRTKKPCIIRSSMQWFIDTNKLKEMALEALGQVKIRPTNISNSMSSTLSSRPYWCISRQRSWGLPIPCFYDSHSDPEHKTPLVNEKFIAMLKSIIHGEKNVDFWWTSKFDHQLKQTLIAGHESHRLVKSNDIFDIWFDSGCSFRTLDASRADLYCEGVDQFSGWFQSSLLLSIALNKQSPYKSLLVHGFVVDEQNRKMSKSVGNVIEPVHAITGNAKMKLPQAGLDTLRFWIAHEYHKPKIQIGPNILDKFLKRSFEIRSIVRFLVANLYDFNVDPSSHVAYDSLFPIDKYILGKFAQLTHGVIENYDDMNLNKVINLIENFLLTQLSSFYIKSVKDRLYCDHQTSLERRAAQTTIFEVLTRLLLLLAPVMPHLAEEAFRNSILSSAGSCLFRSNFNLHTVKTPTEWTNESMDNLFENLVFKIKQNFYEQIKSSNSSLYVVDLTCNESAYKQLDEHSKDPDHKWLIECLQCSKLNLKLSNDHKSSQEFLLSVKNSENFNCLRCRKWVNSHENDYCERCKKILNEN